MKKVLFFICLILAFTQSRSQSFIKFYNAPTSNNMTYAWDVLQSKDHGFVFTGTELIVSGTSVGGKATLWKTDSVGNLLWSKTETLPFTCNDSYGYALKETADSGFIIAGACGYELVLIRTNKNGDTIWTQRQGYYVGNEIDVNMDLTSDSGFIVSGTTGAFGNSVRLLKFDASGILQWTKEYDYKQTQRANDVKQVATGGYIIACTAGLSTDSAYIIRTDVNGDTLWTRIWNNTSNSIKLNSVLNTTDGGFICTGGNVNNGTILKLDDTGGEVWSLTTPSFISYGIYEDTINQTLYSFSWHNSYRLGMQKIAGDGSSIIWSKIYGQFTPNYAGDFIHTTDGGFILNGYGNNGNGDTKAELIKTDAEGDVTTAIKALNPTTAVTIMPNPTNDFIDLASTTNLDATILIINSYGACVKSYEINTQRSRLDISNLPAGVYSLILTSRYENSREVKTFIKLE